MSHRETESNARSGRAKVWIIALAIPVAILLAAWLVYRAF